MYFWHKNMATHLWKIDVIYFLGSKFSHFVNTNTLRNTNILGHLEISLILWDVIGTLIFYLTILRL